MESSVLDSAERKNVAPPTPSNWRLGQRARRIVLVVHILAAGAWVGIDVLVGVFVIAGWVGDDMATRGVAYQALGLFVVWPMLTAGLLSLGSGVLLGLGSKFGLVRYWWVAVKLVINVVLCVLIVVLLQPGLADVASYGRTLSAGGSPSQDVSQLFFPPAVSLTALSLATLLAVFKPWGRIRRRFGR